MTHGTFPSIGEYYRNGPYQGYARECRSVGRTPVDLVRVRQPAGSFPDPPLPALGVLMVTRGVIRTRICLGDRPFTRVQRPGMFVVAPADTACDYEVSGPHEFLAVAIPTAAVAPLADAAGVRVADLGPLHADAHHDPLVEHLCRRLFDEAATAGTVADLFADHALATLVTTLVRLAGRRAAGPVRPRPLPAATLERVLAYLDDHLAGPVALADLAAVARTSVFHFARQFRAAVGEAPHRYLIRRRVERAQELLRDGRLPPAQVAAAVGFADQSHLTRHFKRLTGLTPRQFLTSG